MDADRYAWNILKRHFHQLSIQPGFKLVTPRKHKAGEEKNRSSARKSEKVAKGQVIQEIKHPA